MAELSPKTTWRLAHNEWFLFTNNLFKIKKCEEKKDDVKAKKKPSSKFYFNPRKPESKGTIIYTPEGYGIIQELRGNGEPISIKLNLSGKIKDFDPNVCFVDIPIIIGFMSSNYKGEEKMTISLSTSPRDIVSKIEASFAGDAESIVNVQVFFKGRDLAFHGNNSLEKMGIIPNSRFIAIPEVGVPFTLSRFQNVYEGWGYSDKCINAIAFTTNKSVKIRGFGIFCPDNSNYSENTATSFPTCGKFIKGIDDTGQILYTKEVQVSKQDSDNKIFKFYFERPVRVKPGEIYSCVQEAVGNYSCYSFYGDSGQTEIVGEKDIIFSFLECFTSANNTNRSCGQIPEIYYYA